MPPLPMDARIYVAGHRGLVGSAITRRLCDQGHRPITRTSGELDLRDRAAVFDFFAQARPTHVVLAAAKVGGILANAEQPVEFLSDNLRIQTNVLDAAARYRVGHLLFLGSSCIYPRLAPQPIPEDALLSGPLESTNDAYAIAKIAGVVHVQAIRREFGLPYISAMPTNLYGPGDNFDPYTSHVLPGLIHKLHVAARESRPNVTLWGTGSPRREFLHVDDLAEACQFLLEEYNDAQPINVGAGRDITISELAERVAKVVGYEGEISWDPTKPDGTPRKLLDVSRLNALGWFPSIHLQEGIQATYKWFLDNVA